VDILNEDKDVEVEEYYDEFDDYLNKMVNHHHDEE
jgi:hypothetical protein